MLAGKFAPTMADKLNFPMLVSPKLDGVRAIVVNGVVMSRSMKPIPNNKVQEKFRHLEGLDGELIVGEPWASTVYTDTVSKVMTRDADADDVRFYVFDLLSDEPYCDRLERVHELATDQHGVVVVPQRTASLYDHIEELEQLFLGLGYEGIMLRSPNGKYKDGRSTVREQYLLKLKRFVDSEAVVIGVTELMHNENEAKRNALGHLERSSKKENMVGAGRMGALQVRDLETNIEFEIGTGFDDEARLWWWEHRPLGTIIKYKSFPSGNYAKPRFPVFLGIRDPIDM